MRAELRGRKVGEEDVADLVLISENERESKMIDAVFGSKVLDGDGLIGQGTVQCRLSDGCFEHYLSIRKAELAP